MNILNEFFKNACEHKIYFLEGVHEEIKENTIEKTHIFKCRECNMFGTQLHIIQRHITWESEE